MAIKTLQQSDIISTVDSHKGGQLVTITSQDYANLQPNQKLNVIEALKPIIWDRIYIDLLETTNPLSRFYRLGNFWGNGYSEWRVGKAIFKDFSLDTKERYPTEKQYLGVLAQDFNKKIMITTHITENEVELQNFFSNKNDYVKYVQAMLQSVLDWYNLRQLDFLYTLFGVNTTLRPLYSLTTSDTEYTQAIEWKNKITNKSQYSIAAKDSDNVKLEKMVQHLNTLISDMTLAPTSKYYLDPTVENKEDYPVTIKKEDLILVLSNKDKINFEMNVRSGIYNPNMFNFPNIEQLVLPIPEGTCYVIHKDSIRIAPTLHKQLQEFYPNNLDIEHFFHWQTQYGLSAWLPFIKVESNTI